MAPKKLVAVLFVSLCLMAPLTQAIAVTKCNKNADYDVTVKGVEINPYPVERGKEATFSVNANTGKAISGGKLVIDVSYFGIHVETETHDLCQETSCPVSAGDFVIAHSQTLPSFTPPGSYKLKMQLKDENNHELTCIQFGFRIGFGSSVADV